MKHRKKRLAARPAPTALNQEMDEFEQIMGRRVTPEERRKHEAFIKRRDEFRALSKTEQVDIARWVLAVDPELAEQVREGYVPLFEAYHQLKEAAAFLAELDARGISY
jgi:hypothetical protein